MERDDIGILLFEGRRAVEMGDEKAAEAFFTRAAEAAPMDPEPHVELGRCLNRQGDRKGAIRAMSKAVSIDPDAHAALNRLRWLLRDETLETPSALARIQGRGVEIASVIDVGASNGIWSLGARPCWPQARYHLVEAFSFWREKLEILCAKEPRFTHVIAAAGQCDGEIWFYNNPDTPYGGSARNQTTDGCWLVPQISLTEEVKRQGLKAPYLIKLDTHGFERPILEGAAGILAETNLIIIETYIFKFHPEAMLFYEICAYLAERGFRAIDISQPLWRDRDKALWQMDLFFVRSDRPEFSSNSYK